MIKRIFKRQLSWREVVAMVVLIMAAVMLAILDIQLWMERQARVQEEARHIWKSPTKFDLYLQSQEGLLGFERSLAMKGEDTGVEVAPPLIESRWYGDDDMGILNLSPVPVY